MWLIYDKCAVNLETCTNFFVNSWHGEVSLDIIFPYLDEDGETRRIRISCKNKEEANDLYDDIVRCLSEQQIKVYTCNLEEK